MQAWGRRRLLAVGALGLTGFATGQRWLPSPAAAASGPGADVLDPAASPTGLRLRAGLPLVGDGIDLPTIFHSPDVEPFRDELPRLPIVRGEHLTLTARTTRHRFHRDYDPSPALAYQGGGARPTYLGPVIEAHVDDEQAVTLRNRMGRHPFADDVDPTLHGATASFGADPRTTLHLHGAVVAARYDGNPEDFVVRGEQLTNRYPNRQPATSLWYHDHSLGTTRLNVYAGLAAPYLLRDRWDTGRRDNPLGLPAGEFEVPLVLQEKIFAAGGRQSVRSTPIVPKGSWEGGAVGDTGVVNGKVWPQLRVARGLYRLRLLNAGSYSVWNLHFSNRMRFWVIGSEGGLLDRPVPVRSVRMGPAERYDLLVDFSGLAPGESLTLRNDEPVPSQAAQVGEVVMPLFMRFRATADRGHRGAVPSRLRGGRGLPPSLPAVRRPRRVRRLTINQVNALRIPPAFMTLNNLSFGDPQIERPRQGTTEIWELVNVTADPHSIHLHLVTFRVLERQPVDVVGYKHAHPAPRIGIKWTPSADAFTSGPPVRPPAYERGWKDTVRCDGRSVTRIVVRWPTADELGFDPDAPFRPQGATARRVLAHPEHETAALGGLAGLELAGLGLADLLGMEGGEHHAMAPRHTLRGYMWHCHMLDHEDHDMMLRFRTPARA